MAFSTYNRFLDFNRADCSTFDGKVFETYCGGQSEAAGGSACDSVFGFFYITVDLDENRYLEGDIYNSKCLVEHLTAKNSRNYVGHNRMVRFVGETAHVERDAGSLIW